MGNPKDNSLPQCQLSQIQQMVDAAAEAGKAAGNPQHFWMDTICIPVAKSLKPYRNLSIR